MVFRACTFDCPYCRLTFHADTDWEQRHFQSEHGGAVDREHFDAMKEVDALTPEVPPLIRSGQ